MPECDTVVLSRDVIFNELTSSVEEEDLKIPGNAPVLQEHNTEISFADEHQVENENYTAEEHMLRDRRQLRQPIRYNDYAMFVSEPDSYTAAMKTEQAEQWKNAMNDEMNSLVENNTWELVNAPSGRNVVYNKWVFKVKLCTDGTIDKFKARLVAKGYSQQAGIDYNETFSPVARFDTIQTVLSVAAAEKLHLVHFDVKTAFQ